VRADHPDPAAYVHGVVGPDQAMFAYVQLTTSAAERPGRARLPGLDPERIYRVEALPGAATLRAAGPGWRDGLELSGRALGAAGLQMPVLQPEQALLIRLTAT
jgi:alpha-galactosidase